MRAEAYVRSSLQAKYRESVYFALLVSPHDAFLVVLITTWSKLMMPVRDDSPTSDPVGCIRALAGYVMEAHDLGLLQLAATRSGESRLEMELVVTLASPSRPPLVKWRVNRSPRPPS